MVSLAVTQPEVRAAGGVVTRISGGRREFLLVHRPRYDDWSLPKGKLDDGERLRDAATREITEETGSEVAKVARLGSIAYDTPEGRSKMVRYWLFEHTGGKFAPNPEVDDVRWVTAADAMHMLSYPRDRNVLSWGATLSDSPRAGRIHLVRHAKAGTRSRWDGDDRTRPLSKAGRSQAQSLAASLSASPVARVLSSSLTRCLETMEPLAATLDEGIRDEPFLTEGARVSGLIETISRLEGRAAVLCSHGAEISALIAAVAERGALIHGPAQVPEKASVWTLEVSRGYVTEGRYAVPPL